MTIFRLIDQLSQNKAELRSSYDKIKEELEKVVENEDREKEKLQQKIQELEIKFENEKRKNNTLYDV